MSRKIPGLTSVMEGTGFVSLGAPKGPPKPKAAPHKPAPAEAAAPSRGPALGGEGEGGAPEPTAARRVTSPSTADTTPAPDVVAPSDAVRAETTALPTPVDRASAAETSSTPDVVAGQASAAPDLAAPEDATEEAGEPQGSERTDVTDALPGLEGEGGQPDDAPTLTVEAEAAATVAPAIEIVPIPVPPAAPVPGVVEEGRVGPSTSAVPARAAKPRARAPRPSDPSTNLPARSAPGSAMLLLTEDGTDLSAYVDPEDEAPTRRGTAVKYHGIKLPNAEGAMLKRLADAYGFAMGTMLATELTPLLRKAAEIVAQHGSVRLPNVNTAPRYDSWSVNVPRSPEIEEALATIIERQPVKVHKILVRIAVPAIRARYAREFPEG